MPNIKVQNGPKFEVPIHQKLVLALEDHGVDILHRCGGEARCTTCRVEVLTGKLTPPTDVEQEVLRRRGYSTAQFRLSCQCRVVEDVEVDPVMTVAMAGMDAGPRPRE